MRIRFGMDVVLSVLPFLGIEAYEYHIYIYKSRSPQLCRTHLLCIFGIMAPEFESRILNMADTQIRRSSGG